MFLINCDSNAATDTLPPGALPPGIPVEVELAEYKIAMPAEIPSGLIFFNVINRGTMQHNLRIKGQGIDRKLRADLKPGEKRTLQMDLKQGIYLAYCPVDDHQSKGMFLQLNVKDSLRVPAP
jgi:uncharacterized cupredoxin-like copper-binding protein